jgi:hypothetical protein
VRTAMSAFVTCFKVSASQLAAVRSSREGFAAVTTTQFERPSCVSINSRALASVQLKTTSMQIKKRYDILKTFLVDAVVSMPIAATVRAA